MMRVLTAYEFSHLFFILILELELTCSAPIYRRTDLDQFYDLDQATETWPKATETWPTATQTQNRCDFF